MKKLLNIFLIGFIILGGVSWAQTNATANLGGEIKEGTDALMFIINGVIDNGWGWFKDWGNWVVVLFLLSILASVITMFTKNTSDNVWAQKIKSWLNILALNVKRNQNKTDEDFDRDKEAGN